MWQKSSKERSISSAIAGICAGAALAFGVATVASPAAAAAVTSPKLVKICHGYGCAFRSKLMLGSADGARFSSIMRAGAASPKAERAAL